MPSSGLHAAARAGTHPVTVTIHAGHPGPVVPDDFAGLSFERGPLLSPGNAGVSGNLFSPASNSLITLFRYGIDGEAASRVPARERAKYPGIPWAQIVGLRNRLIHGYDNVDFDILWHIVTQDLPPLIVQLEKMLLAAPQS